MIQNRGGGAYLVFLQSLSELLNILQTLKYAREQKMSHLCELEKYIF